MGRSPLDSLRVVSPCPVPWSSMDGDDRVRFCGKCRKNVYDVATMTTEEALALIERAEGPLCMQITRRPDGRIATGDCRGAARRARRNLIAFVVALPAIVLAQLSSQAFGWRALQSLFRPTVVPVEVDQEVRIGGLIGPESRELIRQQRKLAKRGR